ncbi:DNA-directed RNA polymerase III subunit RPC10 [Strigomonas culicis]|uniref:DNA-directed RNA polymerase subunit n=1 Tax=Strigomonas culicis TaxID=28005 RepID=S9W981_9TRYP|nr:DNA-directed RNA polymerase III subunit RPC10 [Strigomonas culicis]|eukprot:EPY35826.1 DNA-directed RNA polymerase III subunit RPC10 [Strigomonas culicis]
MFFCPFCGTLLLLQNDAARAMLACSTCSYVHLIEADSAHPLTVTHRFDRFNKPMDEGLEESVVGGSVGGDGGGEAAAPGVPEGAVSAEGGQIITVACENPEVQCDSKKALYIQIQMRSADEPPTTFFKCVKCGYQWRQD